MARIGVAAEPSSYRTVVETAGWPEQVPASPAPDLARLRQRAAQAGLTPDIETNATGLRLTWQLPLLDQDPSRTETPASPASLPVR